jgi:hypothetical protein
VGRRSWLLVAGQDSEAGVALPCPAAQAGPEGRHRHNLEVAHGGNQGERGQEERAETDEHGRSGPRPAAQKRAANESGRAERAGETAERSTNGAEDVGEREADRGTRGGRGHDGGGDPDPRRREQPREEHAESDAETGGEPDPVPIAHPTAKCKTERALSAYCESSVH